MITNYKELHEYADILFKGMRNLSSIEEEVNRQKEGIRNLFDYIEKLEQAQQLPANSSMDEKLNVLSAKVKKLKDKFGALKKEIRAALGDIGNRNLQYSDELTKSVTSVPSNTEEVDSPSSVSSLEENSNKNSRLDNAIAEMEKMVKDLQISLAD